MLGKQDCEKPSIFPPYRHIDEKEFSLGSGGPPLPWVLGVLNRLDCCGCGLNIVGVGVVLWFQWLISCLVGM